MKKFYVASVLFILILSLGTVNASNKINALSMDIYVDKSGDAHVTELWECYATEKTEWYHTYKNVGKSKIENFSVSDESGNVFETLSNWDANKDFYEKKNKCGINYINNGYELCFGISEYSSDKKYTVKYDITNFVAQINDAQIVYWTLVDFSQDIGKAYIKIYSDFEYENTLDVWGFGNYGGTCYVHDGYIEMKSKGNLGKKEYMTILVKYPQDTFDITDNEYNKNFKEYLNMAQKGSTKYRGDIIKRFWNGIKYIFIWLIKFLQAALVVGAFTSMCKTCLNLPGKRIVPIIERIKVAQNKEYYRDIPCNGDIFRAYFISYQFGILKDRGDLLGAVFLKWIKEGRMTVEDTKDRKKKRFILNEIDKKFICSSERSLFSILKEASIKGVLIQDSLDMLAKRKYDCLLNWFNDTLNKEKYRLANEGVVRLYTSKTNFKVLDMECLRNEAIHLKGLKKYLKNYTKIADREILEVELFEEYLIYAQIFGIAKKVRKNFKKLYPDLASRASFKDYDSINYINRISYKTVRKADSARTTAISVTSSYSSGGGGFSSGGGGGGSFGGGRRRLKIVISLPI